MATNPSNIKTKRLEVPYFDGLNTNTGANISKKNELMHVENARSRVIGTIEKREGTRRLGSIITATANYGLFTFEEQTTGTNTGFYRLSTVSANTKIYYLNTSATWTALTGNGAGLTASQADTTIAEGNCFVVNGNDANRYITSNGTFVHTSADLGSSTTQFDITNTAGNTYKYTYDSTGTDPLITTNVQVGDVMHIIAQNFTAANNGVFTVTKVDTDYFEVTNASGVVESNKTIGTGAIRVLGHLTGSPIANKVNFYKDRLYLGDYTVGSTNYATGVRMSSTPLGILGLVDGDHDASSTTITVTDTKYIQSDDLIDVYRGSELIETLVVTAKTEDTITVSTTSNALNSSDELWVAGTYGATKVFRWADSSSGGIDVKQYDSFKISGSEGDRIRMFTNINDVMVIANKYNLTTWNDYSLRGVEGDIGCVSDNGYVKLFGALYFVSYKGIYRFYGEGSEVPKLISSKVQPFFDGASKTGLEAAAMGAKGESLFCAIGDVTLYHPDGSVFKELTDVVLEYNLRQDNWYAHTDIEATQFKRYVKSSNVDALEMATSESGYPVHEFLNGQVDDRVTADKEIPMRMDTGNITLSNNFENIVYPSKIIIEAERGSGIQVFISLDNEPFYQIEGEAIKGCTVLKVTSKDADYDKPPRCRQINISIRDTSKKLCRISRIAIEYNETMEEEDAQKRESYD